MKTKKTILLAVVTFIYTTASFATIRTVSNYPTSTIAQFNTIQSAIDASSGGDSVYVHGSPANYSGFTLTNKRLVILGPGWAQDKTPSFRANVVSVSIITGALSSGSEIHGLSFSSSIQINSSKPDSLRFYRNMVTADIQINQASTTYRNYIFEGNVFSGNNSITGNQSSVYQDLIVRNNYFYHNFGFFPPSNMINFNNQASTILIDHNLWIGGEARQCFLSCAYLTITNNIFVRRNAAIDNSSSVFNNNITFLSGQDAPWSVNGNINAGGNVAGQSPMMVDQTAVNNSTNNALLNFTILPGSPAKGTGSDGKDMGLLYDTSGSLNWANCRNSRLPRVYSMNISNPTISVNGILNVNVEARKSN